MMVNGGGYEGCTAPMKYTSQEIISNHHMIVLNMQAFGTNNYVKVSTLWTPYGRHVASYILTTKELTYVRLHQIFYQKRSV